jgi:hypothetical protein
MYRYSCTVCTRDVGNVVESRLVTPPGVRSVLLVVQAAVPVPQVLDLLDLLVLTCN